MTQKQKQQNQNELLKSIKTELSGLSEEKLLNLPRKQLEKKVLQALELQKAVRGNYYKKRFYEFNRDVLGWPDIYEPLHKKVCDFVQDNIKKRKLLLLLPRGSFKSSIVTVGFTLWSIAQDPNIRVLIANATYPMSTSFLSQVKDNLAKNKNFIKYYGDLATNAPVWREDAFATATETSFMSKEPTVTALGVNSNYVGKHFDVAILDDLVNRDNIRTMDRMQEVIDFYKDVLDLVDYDKSKHKKIIVIGTTWSDGDLYSWIQDRDTGILQDFAILKLPAYTGEWGKGDLLFPQKLGWKQLEELRRQQGMSHFASQYLLDPVPPENATFKEFKFYEPSDIRGLKLNKFISVDPAIAENRDSDFSAMVCVGVDMNNNWYILDLWRDKVPPKKLIDQIIIWDKKHRPITTAIESTAFQRTIQYYLREEMKRQNHTFPIRELKHADRTKNERIEALQPRYEMGAVFHNKNLVLDQFLRMELRRFPKSRQDDLSDALSGILEVAMPPKKFEQRKAKYGKGGGYPA